MAKAKTNKVRPSSTKAANSKTASAKVKSVTAKPNRGGIYTKKLGAKLAFSAKPENAIKYHVITGNLKEWKVVADGNVKATKVFETKLGAIEFAKANADKIEGEVIIHKRTGEIEERVSLAKQ